MGQLIKRAASTLAQAWQGLQDIHRLSAAALAVSYACIAIIWVFGTAARWDGQGAILVLPFVLVPYAALPASADLAVIVLWTSWRASVTLLGASLPAWILIWIVMKGR